MAQRKQAIDEQIASREVQHTIENVLDTLYANDKRGYFGIGMTPAEFKSEAIKQLQRKVSTLDSRTRRLREEDYKKGLAKFAQWEKLPPQEKDATAARAREEHISLRRAYELHSKN